MKVSEKFDVNLNPLDFYAKSKNEVHMGRTSINKSFYGDLEAKSQGEMISAMTATEGSAGYVAIEQVEGTLLGAKERIFYEQH